MIALDTSVLVPYLVRDDPVRQERAAALLPTLTPKMQAFIAREVAVELAWVLRRSYGRSPKQVAAIFTALLNTRGIVFENADDVAAAATAHGRGGPEFADLMILWAARRAGALPLYSFDRRVVRLAGVAHPKYARN